jgi:isopenicillin N synthase-like dioxygenase
MSSARISVSRTLPVLDLQRFEQGPVERDRFLRELREAAREVGFFYLTGHGIELEFLQEVLRSARAFFALPEADKLAIEMVNSPHFRGYNRVAAELTRGRPDWREQIDIGSELPKLPIGPDTPPWARLQGPNQWPAALPQLKPVVLRWQAAAAAVLVRLLRCFSVSLGQSENVFEPIYRDEPHTLVKLIRYPGRESTGEHQGVGAHKDASLLSLLLQDQVGGLQVQHADGWIDATPIPGAFVVNIGELLEMASNGYLRATVHRVVTPPAGVERFSVAFFLGARLDATVPLLQLPPELAALERGPERDPNNPLLRDVGRNYLKGRLRSHPDVAQRHHPDLVDPGAPQQASSGY